MDKFELRVVSMGEVQSPGKSEIVLGNFEVSYSGGVKAEKDAAVVLRRLMILLNV